jgi:hypothetical protein
MELANQQSFKSITLSRDSAVCVKVLQVPASSGNPFAAKSDVILQSLSY